ncbi:MAG: DUF2974 domain-containing protein [Sphaerochaetaceae bacterium]|nr:DUF2974 domain-containing protein [Sphaerochaetaceae bacterium]
MSKEKETIYNILDYMDWRGDILPTDLPYSDVDYVIFSELVYAPLENLKDFKGKAIKTLVNEIYPEVLTDKVGFLLKTRYDLWQKVPKAARFADVKLEDFVANFEPEKSKQFAVALFSYNDEAVVAYRGTDSTIVGWKEDMMLSFEVPVPAQADSVAFLDKVIDSKKYKKIFLCGHSKGGNLAKYAATMCKDQSKISGIYDYDGPGLDEASLKSQRWDNIKGKIKGFIPESSVVGLLLGRGTKNSVVRSESVSVMQHNPFYWHVLGGRFILADETTLSSRAIDMALHDFLDKLSNERRRILVETIFGLLESTGARELKQLPSCIAKNFSEVKKMYENVPEEDWEAMKEMWEMFRHSGGYSVRAIYDRDVAPELEHKFSELFKSKKEK